MSYAAAAGVAALPWLNPFTAGPSAAVVPWLVSAACGLVLLLLAGGGTRVHGGLAAVLGGIVVWAVVSHGSLSQDIVALAAGLTLVFVTASAVADRGAARGVQAGLLIAAVLSASAGLLQYAGFSPALGPWINYAPIGEAYGNLRQPNQYASLCWLGVAVLLWGRPRVPLSLALPAVILLAVASAASVSRTGMMQGLLLTVLVAVWGGAHCRRRLLLCVSAAVAYYAAAVLLPLALEHFTGVVPPRTLWGRMSGGESCSSRAVLWANVLDLIAHRPVLGWGWGELDYAHFMTLYPGARFCDILDNAHNLPLHLAVELGVPAAATISGLGLLWMLRLRPFHEHGAQRQLALAMLGVLLLHSLLEYPLWYGPFQIAFGASLGWLLRRPDQPRPRCQRTTRLARAGATALLAVTAGAAWDYWRVSQVYMTPDHRYSAWRENPLNAAKGSWLFAPQAEFAELTLTQVTPGNAAQTAATARDMLHYSPEPRVVERLVEADTLLGRDQEAVSLLARYRAAFPADYAHWRESQGLGASGASPQD